MPRRSFNNVSAIALLAAVLSGCASKEPVARPDEQANRFVGKDPVYAILTRRGGGDWTFTEVSDKFREPEDGYPVRLNDLSPAFDVRPAECEPRPYRENDRCNPLNPFRDKNMGIVGKIVDTGLSAGTGGTISGVSRSYSTEFDRLSFNAAVDQALLLTGFDDNRVAFLNGLSEIAGKTAAQSAEIENIKAQAIGQYKEDKKKSIKIDTRISGLTQYYSDDLNPADFVDVLADGATKVTTTAERADISLLPCDATTCMQNLNALLSNLDRKHAERIASLQVELRDQTDTYAVDCSATEYAGYHFRLHCPERLARNQDGIIVMPIEIEILSRDFEHLFPEFKKDNGQLAAAVQNGQLMLKNQTGEFIDVQSVTVYYNSQINTASDIGSRLDLAPYQFAEIPLAEFSSSAIDIASHHTNMTPDKASRAHFSFGLAIKYSLHNRDVVETLYGANRFNLQCAIESRLRPGSCSNAMAKETEAAANSPIYR